MAAFLLCTLIGNGGCFFSNKVETYYGRVVVPQAAEFRWNNGGLPQQFDPALAAAPPDTDAVRALYEGLTEYDSRTLAPVPGVALRWEASENNRVWTFFLRRDARWSNDDPVTARDFVYSWHRAVSLGEQAPHAKLLENIAGARRVDNNVINPALGNARASAAATDDASKKTASTHKRAAPPFGAETLGDYVLRVRLERPDANFPALVAHTIFRPVRAEQTGASGDLNADKSGVSRLITNGAFRLAAAGHDGVVLERAENYWDAPDVALKRIRFVVASNAEASLAAYRAGEVDAVTNAGFEPLALKMLAPYKDFHRATYGALTFYSFNTTRPPFDDVRVRQAMALAIDRNRLSEDEMGGATEPAARFLPAQLSDKSNTADASAPLLEHNVARARQLFAAAGYADGNKFPRVRLLVNRNDQQRAVAQAVAAMWHDALGIATVVIVKDWESYEAALGAGEYDVARRGIVMQTLDEAMNIRAMFELNGSSTQPQKLKREMTPIKSAVEPIVTEAQALEQLPAIPLYFASSYSLAKPYVTGFETNLLDAPLLKNVRINTGWQMPQPASIGVLETTEQ